MLQKIVLLVFAFALVGMGGTIAQKEHAPVGAQQTNHTRDSSGVLTHPNRDRRLAMTISAPLTEDPFADILATTQRHLAQHSCGAYPFQDGPALISLANEHRPKRVLELGTALSYTAACLAHGSPQAHVDTIEGDASHVVLAREQIAQHDLSARISVHQGDFDTVLSTLQPGYDMAFFDGFAPELDTILHVRKLLAVGGVLICSNLQLGSGNEARRLAAELADESHWQRQDPIEDGRTVVLIKRAVPDSPQE
jgi:predicted O-methyltransferase YrrM